MRMRRLPSAGFAFAVALFAAQAVLGTAPARAEDLSGTLKKIKETGAISLGFRDSSIPFSYLDDNQKPIGYAMDICYSIVEAVKKELKLDQLAVELVPVSSSTRIPLLANGTIDLECGSTTNNRNGRDRSLSATPTSSPRRGSFRRKRTSSTGSRTSVASRWSATSGTSNIRQLIETNAARNLDINVIHAKDHAEAFLMVENDRAVAFVMDDILLAAFAVGSKNPDAYAISSDAFSKPEPCGIMLRRDDPAFKKVVDDATAALYQSADGPKLYEKWFMQKIPPKGLNLNVPMGAELRHEFAKPSDSSDPDAYKVM